MDNLIASKRLQLFPGDSKVLRDPDGSDRRCVTQYFDSKGFEENLRKPARRDTRGCFSSAGTFQDVSGVGLIELQGTCQVSPNFKVGEATQRLDARLAWNSTNEKYGVAAFVTNVLDDQYVTGVNNLTTDIFGTPFASISEPRMSEL